MGLFRFYRQANDLRAAGDLSSGYHRTIVRRGTALGCVGFVLGLVAWGVALAHPDEFKNGKDAKAIILAPVLFPVPLIILGAVYSLAVAPNEFLRGPAGRQWMAVFGGTDNPATARAFCWVVLSLFALVPAGIALFVWSNWRR